MLKLKLGTHEKLLRQFRKKPLVEADLMPKNVEFEVEDIKKILPHRDPILLLDKITGVDLEEKLIVGSRFTSSEDPVYTGHFPDNPVYPGTLQLEAIGQMGVCLQYFIQNETISINDDSKPFGVLATRIRGASFVEPVKPDTVMTIVVQKLRQKKTFSTFIGQLLVNGKIACVSVGELLLLG